MRNTGTAPTWQDALYVAVSDRLTPEDVAGIVLEHFPNPINIKGWQLRAKRSRYSWMERDFESPQPLLHTGNILAQQIGEPAITLEQASDTAFISDLCAKARQYICAPDGELNFKTGRLNRQGRKDSGVDVPKRKYNRIFRLIRFLEEENEGNIQFGALCKALRIAKSALITDLSKEEFGKDPDTAQFVAYMSARLNKRSTFTNGAQERAFDDHAEAMLNVLLEQAEYTNWWAVAHAFPRGDVLAKLTDEQKLALLDLATIHMQETAQLLARLAEDGGIDPRKSTTVRAGNDSSSWNYAAGAWNKVRDWWVALVQELGMESVFDNYLPGKVMRLMAADVVAWHYNSGGKAHPDTLVSQELPNPWDVVLGEARCTREDVLKACKNHQVDAIASGWASARARTAIEEWNFTPELVHGVTVNHPVLAYMLRKAGWWAGGPSKSRATV